MNYLLLSSPGPTAEDVDNASRMSNDERQEMIRGMVSRLSERLSTDGGSPNEWARLINALGVLGEIQSAKNAWKHAKNIFTGSPSAQEILNTAAQNIGLK